MSERMDRARAEAERRVAAKRERMWDDEGEHLGHSWGEGFKAGFREGAEWARGVCTLPERFRDPSALAKFVIENEWALDSESDPNVRADWYETLHRVFDTWDADTPEDIVCVIADAIRLDREFRDFREESERIPQAPLSLKDLEAAWEAAEQADECRKGDMIIVRPSRGEYIIREVKGSFRLAPTTRVLSRAPRREPWEDLADVIREEWPNAYDEIDIGSLAYALHDRGVRVTAQAESEGGA